MFNWLKKSKKSKWIDVSVYDDCKGYYKLVQMRYTLDTNKKEFRNVSMAFMNDQGSRLTLFENVLKHNSEDDTDKNLWDEIDKEINREVEEYNKNLNIRKN